MSDIENDDPVQLGVGGEPMDSDDEVFENGGVGNGARTPASALEENILKKGKNSYYYAHTRKSDAPAWDGNAEPRLLTRESRTAAVSERPTEPIESYAWADEKEKVRIYVDVIGGEAISDDNIRLDWTATSVTLQVVGGDVAEGKEPVRVLNLPRLYDTIEEASFRRKKDRITVTLKKGGDTKSNTWWELKKDL